MENQRMTRYIAISACALAIIALSAAYHHVRAQAQQSPRLPIKVASGAGSPTLIDGPHQLVATDFSWANKQLKVGTGYQPVDSLHRFTCKAAGGCTIGVEQQVQLLGLTSNDAWGICTWVDGSNIFTPGCPFQGDLPVGNYVVGSWSQQASVSQGDHTIQTFIYTTSGAEEDTYNIIYRIYEP